MRNHWLKTHSDDELDVIAIQLVGVCRCNYNRVTITATATSVRHSAHFVCIIYSPYDCGHLAQSISNKLSSGNSSSTSIKQQASVPRVAAHTKHHGNRGPVPGLYRQLRLHRGWAMWAQGGLLTMCGTAAVCDGRHQVHAVQAGQPFCLFHTLYGRLHSVLTSCRIQQAPGMLNHRQCESGTSNCSRQLRSSF